MRQPVSAAAEAYLWGFPLLSVHRTRLLLCSRTDTGSMHHVNELATPRDRAVVLPNNDTLYSSGWYDLQHGDLWIDVPAMDHPDRYWNVMIVDAYTHTTYVRRKQHGVNGTRVRVTYDPDAAPASEARTVVRLGTKTAWVIVRVLVESPADMDTARALQRAIAVQAPASHPHERTVRAGRATAIADSGASVFTELKAYTTLDPPAPWHPQLSAEAQAIVRDPESMSAALLEAGIEEGEQLMASRNRSSTVERNGWSTGREAAGPGDDILKRATGSKFGLGGHQAIENRSYRALGDAEGQSLDGNRPLTLRFDAGAMPPCSAFWSLTVYGTDLYLVENEIDRWSISDRTPGLVYDSDGSLLIHISAERPVDSANWLPAPTGPYILGMRVYEGHDAVIDCDWFPPVLTHLSR